jgi:hypothetical protein
VGRQRTRAFFICCSAGCRDSGERATPQSTTELPARFGGWYNPGEMHTKRTISTVFTALILTVGMACAQWCNVGCAFPADYLQALAKAQPSTQQSEGQQSEGHCHQHKSGETKNQEPLPPEKDNHSSHCLPHDSADLTTKSGSGSIAASLQPDSLFLAVGPMPPVIFSLDEISDACARAACCHSPPRAVFSVLRI